MNLSQYFNFYIFQLVHAVKISDIEFIIDDMTTVLIEKSKRSSYTEEKFETAKIAKNTFREDEAKFNSSTNTKSNNKRNRDKKSCSISDCNSEYHDDKHCSYTHSNQRDKN